jgi:hypothetical protein
MAMHMGMMNMGHHAMNQDANMHQGPQGNMNSGMNTSFPPGMNTSPHPNGNTTIPVAPPKPDQKHLCPSNDPMAWLSNNRQCSKCQSLMNKTGWFCHKCNHKVCDKCASTSFTAKFCPNNDQNLWLTNNYPCSKCESIMNKKGWYCAKCNFKLCDKCAGTSFVGKHCPN